jgi:adenylate kinase family enzyme
MSLRRTPVKTVQDTIDFKEGFLQTKMPTDNSAMESLQREVSELKSKLDLATKAPEPVTTFSSRAPHHREAPRHESSYHPRHAIPKHHSSEHSMDSKAANVMAKLDRLESQLRQDACNKEASDHLRVMSKLDKLEARLSTPPDSTKVMSKLDNLDAKLSAPADHISTKVMSKLDNLEARLSAPVDHISTKVMSKLDNLEAKLGMSVCTDPIMAKLNKMEAKLGTPDHVMSKLDQLERCLPTNDKLGSAMTHINKVHSELQVQKSLSDQVMDKLTHLENKLNIQRKAPAVTLDMYENERKNLAKLERMRAKLAQCG